MKNRSDWSLLTLHYAEKKGLTPAQLQKTMFLLQKAFPQAEKLNYNFRPYNYGPFDSNVYEDVESLSLQGLAELRKKNGQNWSTYHISLNGQKRATEILKKNTSSTLSYLKMLVSWIQPLAFQELIAAVYKKYPEYKSHSIFKG